MEINNKEIAKYYHNLGFNICCISNKKTNFNKSARDILKSPLGPWKHFRFERQSLNELLDYDWHSSTGMGVVLGYNNLRAIDVDETDGPVSKFIEICLEHLKLPKDYEWVVQSGSGKGFHILFYAIDENWKDQFKPYQIKSKNIDEHNLHPDYDLNIVAFGPALGAFSMAEKALTWEKLAGNNDEGLIHEDTLKLNNGEFSISPIYLAFKRFELRSEGFLVLPPSIHSNSESSKYKFINLSLPNIIPKSLPLRVENKNIKKLIQHACVYTKFTFGS